MTPAILIRGGEIHAPEYIGVQDVLSIGENILAVGQVDRASLDRLGLDYVTIDAESCVVTPGFIDPHEHLIGGSGEAGFATQTPEITLPELIQAGITTAVGCLGVDTATRSMPALLGKTKALRESGISAYLYSGGYDVPPRTLTGSLRTDIMYLAEVIGAGEIAISDARSCQPTTSELARVVADAYVGGLLAGKCGVTHFHVGPGPRGLAPLRELLENHDVHPASLYPTHVERSERLMREAVALTAQGVTVDIDTVDRDLARWLPFYFDAGGLARNLTLSSDAAITSPCTLFEELRIQVLEGRFELAMLLGLVTANPARALGLRRKGRVAIGADADLLVLDKRDFRLKHVVARGQRMMDDGRVTAKSPALEHSNRRIELYGQKIG